MYQPSRHALAAVAVAAVVAAGISAQSITGTVVAQAGGAPIAGVLVHFSGTSTPPDATTSATGAFTAPVPAGIYTVDFEPPATTFAPKRIENVVVTTGTVALGTVSLAPGIVLTGHVQNVSGAPVVNGDTDVVVAATGQKLYTPNDNTDAAGNFAVVVAAGTYRVEADAPTGQLLVSQQSSPFTVSGTMNMGTITLPPGVALSGTVRNSQTQAPLQNVDIDIDDMATGARVITPTDKTDALGFFSVVVPTGIYRTAFDPPPGMAIVGGEAFNVLVPGTLNLGNIPLNPGFLLSGSVLNPSSQPVAGADIDVENVLGGVKVYTPNDSTLVNGTFQVAVPAGTYRVKVAPPASPVLAPAVTNPIVVNAATAVPTFVLAPGFTLSGTIQAWNGSGEKFARIDVVNPSNGAELYTPGDVASLSGAYSIVVPAGTWNFRVRADHASLSQNATFNGVLVSGNTSFSPSLVQTPIANYLVPSAGVPPIGYLTIPNGSVLWTDAAIYNPTFNPRTVNLSVSVFDPAGTELSLFAGVPFTMQPFEFVVILSFPVVPPPWTPPHLGFPGRLRFVVTDPGSGAVIDYDEFQFVQG